MVEKANSEHALFPVLRKSLAHQQLFSITTKYIDKSYGFSYLYDDINIFVTILDIFSLVNDVEWR